MIKQKVNIVFLSDTHLGLDYPLKPRIMRQHRGTDFFQNFETVLAYAVQIKADLVIHAGDFFFRSRIPTPIVDKAYQMLLDFTRYQIPICLVPGNHERSRLPDSLFLCHPMIHVFSECQTRLFTIKQTKISVSGFPFERHNIRTRFKQLVRNCLWDEIRAEIKLLFFHQVIEGATVGPGDYRFPANSDSVAISDLPDDAAAILCGHIHRQQILRNHRNPDIPIILSGSTERTSFAEMNEEKGFCHLVFSPITSRLTQIRFIPIRTRPMSDILIPPNLQPDKVHVFLENCVRDIDKRAILRFKADTSIIHETAEKFTHSFLRSVLPETVNFSVSRSVYQNSDEQIIK